MKPDSLPGASNHRVPPGSATYQHAEFADLLGAIESLLLTGPRLGEFLNRLAVLAAHIVRPVASCSVTTRYDGRPHTVARSDQQAALIDEQQYTDDDGPCLQTLRTGTIVSVPDQAADERWPGYRARALDLGIRCSLTFPLVVDAHTIGAMNLYGYDHAHAFEGRQRQRAETFAGQASHALALAVRQTEQAELTAQLTQALSSRRLIDQATGILMGQQRCDDDTAFDQLRAHSQTNNRTLRDVAADLITTVSGHAPVTPQPVQTRTRHQTTENVDNDPRIRAYHPSLDGN